MQQECSLDKERGEWKKEAEIKQLVIIAEMVGKKARKIKNWLAPTENELYGLWLKYLTGLHWLIAKHFNNILQGVKTEDWLISGKTLSDNEKSQQKGQRQPIIF